MDGYTALHIAAQNDKLLAIIRALIATGANPNIANNNGNTPLLMAVKAAVKAGDIRISRILIDVGSDVNIPYLSGDTHYTWRLKTGIFGRSLTLYRGGGGP